eukprot:1425813-Heterocapsa_arctica.AAC.1
MVEALSKGVVRFWDREALRTECAAAMVKSKEAGSLTPGQHPTVQLLYEHELPIVLESDAQADTAPSGGTCYTT